VNTPAAVFPVLSVTDMPYVPATAVPGTTTEPETWPVPADMLHVGAPNAGTVTAVQDVAAELNPDPVKVNTVLTVPDVGVTVTSGITVNPASGVRSFTGDPCTATFHAISLVAYGPTTKVPCAVPGVVTEQVGEVIRLLLGLVTTPLNACTVHPVSEALSPVPMKVTVAPSTALVGSSVIVAGPETTETIVCAKSPALGAQPLLPLQPVTSITYSPGCTLPIMKLPVTIPVPTVITHPAEPARIGLRLPGLLMEHD